MRRGLISRTSAGHLRWSTGLAIAALAAILLTSLVPISPPKAAHPVLQSPAAHPPLGTDVLGRPYLELVGYALVKTLRITLTALVAGTVAGWTLAIFGAVLGRGVSFLGELIHVFASSLPPALVALMFASFAARTGQADLWLTGALTLLEVHRSYRAATRTAARVKVAPHTVAAQALGASQWFLIRHYYLPEVWQLWKPAFALELADLAAIEATVSFLGLGSTTADPTLGRLVADGRYFLATAPWLVSAPALVIVALLAAGVRQLFVARGTQ